ncbi:Protoglobin-domain-containing protein [Plectosphaerella plurivora]|uniref:Protoglobin-domain-containing protein n=1 Tax=Plectosphaerella plurivora TaxID=936078 RepID=A0A9P8VED4_9PEZI|nr:Protoglobin-domain-containing protein [Plectosphaerella plurivora]
MGGGFHRLLIPVKREDLYTDIEARVRYLHSFVDFNHRDIEALVTGSKYTKALIPAVVNIVYKKLLQYDITARAFTTRSTSFEGPMDDMPDENSPQIMHRKMFMRAYLNKLCSDPSRMEFWEYLDKVGMMHVGLGRAHPLHIEYIHLGICLGFIQDIMTEAILSHPRLHLQRKIALVKALGKVIWIQNDLMAKWHVRDGEEFREAGEEFVIEEEGYLHGKKVFTDSDEEVDPAAAAAAAAAPDSPSRIPRPHMAAAPASVCPFSGLSQGMKDVKISEDSDKTPTEASVAAEVSVSQ